jgi:hypothetical protein
VKKTKTKCCLLGALIFSVCFFIFPENAFASTDYLIISEIMYDPGGTDTGHTDWVEIYNPTADTISIKKENFGLIDEEKLELAKDGVHYLNCHKIKEDLSLPAGGFLILADNDAEFKTDYPAVSAKIIDSTFSLSTDGDTIHLSADKCATFFEEIKYVDSWGAKNNGNTLEKIKLTGDNDQDNWQESYVAGGTPGAENSQKPKLKEYSKDIYINEILPNPINEDDEYIELYNSGSTDVDLENWILRDSSKAGKYVFFKGAEIKAGEYLAVYKKDYKFALNNTGDENIYLYNPKEEIVSQVLYSGSRENVSFNFDGSLWRWSKYLTPGAENKFNNPPTYEIIKPKKIYRGVWADFSVKAKDLDEDNLKITWDFGDKHKSYLAKTRHKYLDDGIYNISVKIFDGSEEVIGNFPVQVGKFKKKGISISSFSANPTGKDSDLEWIEITNNSKKKINLKGWSVATGWKKLYNHPITKKLIIEPGKSAKLTRKICKFTLNNKKNKIELRYPDGQVADKIKYNKGEESVADDEVYAKEENEWEWIEAQKNPVKSTKVDNGASTETEELSNIENQESNNEGTENPESFEEFMGGRSVNDNDQKNKEELLNYGTHIRLASANFQNQPMVLGAETIRLENNVYNFTQPINEESRTKKLFRNMGMEINYLINKIIFLFS